MNLPNNPYVLPVLFGAIVSALVAVFTWRRRPAPGATPAALVMLGIAVWCLGFAFELVSPDLAGKIFWAKFEYFGVVSVPLTWFAFALEYTGHERFWSRRRIALLLLVPLLTLVLVWTNEQHGLFWSRFELDTELGFVMSNRTRNVGFYINWIYAYALLLPSGVLLFRWLAQSKFLYRRQAVVVVIATVTPWIGNFLFVTGLNPFPRLDLTLLGFVVSSVAMALGLYRYRLLDLVPVAQDKVIENMQDAVLVVDAQNRIVNANPAVQTLLELDAKSVIGRNAADVFSAYAEFIAQFRDVFDTHTEITRGTGPDQRWLDLRISSLRVHHPGQLDGRVLVLRDITEQKRSEQERERLYTNLQAELAERERAQAALEELTDELEQRVAKRTTDLERANETLTVEIDERTRAEEKLLVLEMRYRRLFEAAKDGILILDADTGEIVDVNPFLIEMLGYSHAEFLGKQLWEIGLFKDIVANKASFVKLRAQGYIRYENLPLETRDGRSISVEFVSNVYAVSEKQVIQCNIRDITARKRAEEALRASEERFRSLFENATIGLYRTTPDGRILLANPTLIRMLGFNSFDELTQRNLEEEGFAPAYPRSQFCQRVEQEEEIRGFESAWTRRDGSVIFVRESAKAIRGADGAALYYEGTVEDITARKQAEEAAARRLTELEAVNRISTALRTARTLDEMLPRLLDETLAVLQTDSGVVFDCDTERNRLVKQIARGWFTRVSDAPMEAREGIAGIVVTTNQPYYVREFASDPRLRESIRHRVPAGWSGVAVPIRAEQEIIGVLFVSVPLPRELTPDEVRLLTTLSEIAGNAIHRTRLHAQTERRLEHVQALRAIDMTITSSFDLRLTLDILLEHVVAELRVDAAAVLVLHPQLQTLSFAAGRGFRGSGITHLSLRLGEDYAGQAALERRRVSVRNLKAAERPFTKAPLTAGEDFIAYYGVPLIAKGQVKGVLEVFHRALLDPDEEWLDFLETLAGQTAVAIDNLELFTDLQRSNLELAVAYNATIEGWSRALDLRDRETEGHTQRVVEMTEQLARAMGMSDAELVHVRRGVLLHDIGKMGVPDAILLKPDKLTDEEWKTMHQHPKFAYDMLAPIAYLHPALDIPYCHHEKWDGTGYPRGLQGEQIPLAARIFAVVDVWDALTSDRSYRKAWTKEQAREYIREQAGKHFDPQVVKVFLKMRK